MFILKPMLRRSGRCYTSKAKKCLIELRCFGVVSRLHSGTYLGHIQDILYMDLDKAR